MNSPLRLVLRALLAIFIAEALIMFVLAQLPAMGTWIKVLLDVSALMLILAPLCWHWLATIEREHHAVEKQLREGEARYHELFDDAPVGYHELDVRGRILRVNRTEPQLLGYTVEEMLGHAAAEFVANSASGITTWRSSGSIGTSACLGFTASRRRRLRAPGRRGSNGCIPKIRPGSNRCWATARRTSTRRILVAVMDCALQ